VPSLILKFFVAEAEVVAIPMIPLSDEDEDVMD
jgi:hypothetical protein